MQEEASMKMDGWMDGRRSRVALSVTTDGRGNISQRDVALVRKKKRP